MAWYFLIFSAICDAFYNVFLKKVSSFTDYKNILLVVFLLSGSILGFKKGLSTIQMSTALLVWSGISIIATIILDIIIYKAKFDIKIAFFMCLCIVSIIGLNYYANK